jgi:hypothetical protein
MIDDKHKLHADDLKLISAGFQLIEIDLLQRKKQASDRRPLGPASAEVAGRHRSMLASR